MEAASGWYRARTCQSTCRHDCQLSLLLFAPLSYGELGHLILPSVLDAAVVDLVNADSLGLAVRLRGRDARDYRREDNHESREHGGA